MDKEIVALPFPYKFTTDGSDMTKGVSTDFSHEQYKGMDFFTFDYLGLNDATDDYNWIGINYEETILTNPNSDTFVGSGLDDLTAAGTITNTTNQDIVITIDATGTPDTFTVTGAGDTELTVAITGSAQAITGANGLTVAFAATTGHTVDDKWYISTLGTLHYGEDILKAWEAA